MLDFLATAWPAFLVVWVIGVVVHAAWHGKPFLERRRQEIRDGEWSTAVGITAFTVAMVLWWSVVALAMVALAIGVILWLLYRSGAGG